MNQPKAKKSVASFFKQLYISYIPNRGDTFLQVLTKILFLVCFITLIVSSVYLADYFLEAERQDSIIEDSRSAWHEAAVKIPSPNEGAVTQEEVDPLADMKKKMLEENGDFKGWISISNTKVDNPIYQADDNSFYLNHNQKKQRSVYGALYFDCEDVIDKEQTDKNLVVFGHRMKNGSMFGTLKKFRSLDFYKQNPTIEFSTLYKKSTYKIYAIFVLNAVKADDQNYIYNIYKQNFINETEFNTWRDEAYDRSIIDTGVDVKMNDRILTLVTCTSDFENARLIIMAREVREGENPEVDTSLASVNPNPRYPKKWYTSRGLK